MDSLIVTDLVELARNSAITDAVLLSGDEDVRVGVQIAQNFGVRVHLLGIEPSRQSQSRSLLQESDTTTEWSKSDVAEFLSLSSSVEPEDSEVGEMNAPEISTEIDLALDQVVDELLTTIDNISARDSLDFSQGRIPHTYDRSLLRRGGIRIGRNLNFHERESLRVKFRSRMSEAGYI